MHYAGCNPATHSMKIYGVIRLESAVVTNVSQTQIGKQLTAGEIESTHGGHPDTTENTFGMVF